MDDLNPISPVVPLAPAAPAGAPATVTDPAAFRRILERLEQLAKTEPPTGVRDAEGLVDAMRKAEDGFTSAMDLRRQLESAFRERTR